MHACPPAHVLKIEQSKNSNDRFIKERVGGDAILCKRP